MGDPLIIIISENIGIKDSSFYEEIHVQFLDSQVLKFRAKEIASDNLL